jgi:hypothetical protein
MQRFIQFYITDHRGQVERLGSDGVALCDGRWSLETAHTYAQNIARQRGASGYQLRQGKFSKYRKLSNVIPVGAR